MKCHNCGTELAEGVKFCHECGEKHGPARQAIFSEQEISEIQQKARPDEYLEKLQRMVKEGLEIERREVAVLFADLSGYTRMLSEVSAEEFREIMWDVYSVMSEAIAKCGGYVDKFVGDEVMALFGAPIALECPCERAITAVDEIQIGLAGVNHRFGAILPTSLSVHAGVAFGTVQAGRLGGSMKLEYSVMGEAVILAVRLTDAAPSGALFVTKKVEERARHAFEFESIGKQQLAGIEQPVEAFRLVGPRTVIGERPKFGKLGAPMFGRDDEFGKLKQVFEKFVGCYPGPEPCETGQGKYRQFSHVLGITGEAGIGKSRLKRELQKHVRERLGDAGFRCLAAGACSIGQTPLYWPIKMQIASGVGFDMSASSQTIVSALTSFGLGKTGDDAKSVPYLYHLFGLQHPEGALGALEPKAVKDNLWIAIRSLYGRWSQDGPLLLVFEDMHWADGGSVDFLDYLADFVSDFPVLVILLYRPGYKPKFAKREGVPFTELKLRRLSSHAETDLLSFYLAAGEREQMLMRRLKKYSEGNPLFAEEFLHMLLDRGKLKLERSKMRLTGEVERMPLPTGLSEVLGERFDRLSHRDKRVAYYGAVIGRSFLYSLLSDVHKSLHGVGEVRGVLDSLVQREIVFEKAIEPELEYIFKHAITREILVSRLVESLRRELSRLIATRVEQLYGDRIEQFHGMLSEHWELAGETERAARHAAFCCIYNRKQERNFEAQAAFEQYDQIRQRLASGPLSSEEEASLLISRIDVLQVLGRRKEAIDFCEVLSGLGEGRWRCIALCKEARLREQMGDWDRSLSLAEQALAASQQVGDRKTEAEAVRIMGIVHEQRGDWDRASRFFAKSLELHRESGDRRGIAKSLVSIGIVKLARSGYDQAIRHCNEALEIGRELGDRGTIATALIIIGVVHEQRGDYDEALRYYNEALEIHRELGDRSETPASLHNIGNVNKDRGDYELALGYYDEALSMFRELGDRRRTALSLHGIGEVQCCRGNYDRALQCLDEALSLFDELGDRPSIGYSLNSIAGVRAITGNWAESKKAALQAEKINRAIDSRPSLSDSLSVLCRADAAVGNWEGSLAFGTEAKSIADGIEQKEQMINSRLALSEAHLYMVRWITEGEQGPTPPLSRGDARKKAIEHAREAKEIAESRGMKGHAQKAEELLARIEGG